MKHIAGIVTVAVLMIAGNLFASSVDEIALSHEKGTTIARIMVDGPIRYIHQTEIPKDGKPHRVIVDILSGVHELGVKDYSDVPACPVTSIRTSQYSVTPEKIVRVVFDLARPPLYNIESSGKAVVITFQDKDTKPFANWSTTGLVRAVAAKKSPQPPTKPPKSEKKPVTVARKNEAIDKDRLASLQSQTAKKQVPEKATTTSRKSASKPIVAKVKFSDSIYGPEFDGQSPAGKPAAKPAAAVPSSAKKAQVKAKALSKPAPVTDKKSASTKTPVTEQDAARKLSHAPDPILSQKTTAPVVSKAPVAEQKKPAEKHPAKAEPGVRTATKGKPVESTTPKKQVVATPATDKTVAKPQTTAEKSKDEVKTSPTKKVSTAPKQATGQKALASKVKSDKKAQPQKKKQTESPKKTVTASKAAPQSQATTPVQSTSRFRREPAKIRGTMVAEFPKRLTIKYRQRLNRDPFGSLVDDTKAYEGPIETRVPNVEGLQLVGILDSEGSANRALLEDKQGFSYILKSGDKVKKGYVLRVETDRVYFQIFEYGWSRTIALTLDEY